MLQILKQYIENNLMVTEYTEDGFSPKKITKEAIPLELPIYTPPSQPTLEEQIQDIKNTVDLLLLKQEGLI